MAAALFCLLSAFVAEAATINVNSSCSLDNAIRSANTDASVGGCTAGSSQDRLEIQSSFTVSGAAPSITTDIVIDGNGHTISGGAQHSLFHVDGQGVSDLVFLLSDITLKDFRGHCNSNLGAVIDAYNAEVTIDNSVIKDSKGGKGCGNYSDLGYAAITLIDSDLVITNSVISGNGSLSSAVPYGVAVASSVSSGESQAVVISDTIFRNNKASSGSRGFGGAVAVFGAGSARVDIFLSGFINNQAGNTGGALYFGDGVHSYIESSYFKGNRAVNALGGAIANFGAATLEDVTLYDNRAKRAGAAIFSSGWDDDDASLKLTHVTVHNNKSDNGGGSVVSEAKASLDLANSILSGTRGGGKDCVSDGGSTIGIKRGNLIQDGSCLGIVSAFNLRGNPGFGSWYETHLPLNKGSQAIDAGVIRKASCTGNDGRGARRPQGRGCDIGAYEFPGIGLGQTKVDFRTNWSYANHTDAHVFSFNSYFSNNISILLETEKQSDALVKVEVYGIYYDGRFWPSAPLVSKEIDASNQTLALIYNFAIAGSPNAYNIKVSAKKKSDNSAIKVNYELTLGRRQLTAYANKNRFKVFRAACAISATDDIGVITFGYKPPTFRFNLHVDLKTAKLGAGSEEPWFWLALTTIDQASQEDYDELKNLSSNIDDAAKVIKYGATVYHIREVAIAAKAGLAAKGGAALAIKAGASAVGGPVVLGVAVGALALKAYNEIAYTAALYVEQQNLATGTYSEYPFLLPGTGVATIAPNAFSRGFILTAFVKNTTDDGAFVLTTSDLGGFSWRTKVHRDTTTRWLSDWGSSVAKTIICPGGSFDPSVTSPSSLSWASASAKSTKSTGQQLNDDATNGINVSAFHGLDSGAQFQRRSAGDVMMMRAASIQTVVDAGIADAVEVWGYAEQPWDVCYDSGKVGGGAVVFIHKPNAGDPIVDLNPGAAVNELDQTCVSGNSAGVVVLLATAPPGVLPASYETASSVLPPGCMVTLNYSLNLRGAPDAAGELINILPYNVTLSALEQVDGWIKVDYHGQQGWVSAAYTSEVKDCGSPASPVAVSPAPAGCMVTTTNIVNIRQSPSLAGAPVRNQHGAMLIEYNATLTALERADGWVKVDYHGTQGWISSRYLTERSCG